VIAEHMAVEFATGLVGLQLKAEMRETSNRRHMLAGGSGHV
jgi:hypothetical protein